MKLTKARKDRMREILLVFIVSYITLFGYILTKNILDLDELWTFSFSSKIANGFMIYRDFNVLQTPLYAQITAIFLKIFGNTMFVSHLVGVLEGAILLVVQYMIMRKLSISKKTTVFSMFLIIYYVMNFICNSYNILALLFAFIFMYFEICKIKYDKYIKLTHSEEKRRTKLKIKQSFIYNMITGIVIGLTFLSKQNIGVYLILVVTGYYFLRSILVKDITFIDAFKQLSIKAIFCILIIGIEALYLYLNGALYACIDYTILGLLHFGQKVNGSIFNLLFSEKNRWYVIIVNALLVFSIIFLIMCCIMKKLNLIKRKNKMDLNILILLTLFCIIGIGYSIPLANTYHMYLTKYVIFYLLLININLISFFSRTFYKQISKVSVYIMIATLIICGVSKYVTSNLGTYRTKMPMFKNLYLSYDGEKDIETVVTYMLTHEEKYNQPIYMITSDCSIYNLVLGRNNGVFDLPLYGNLGKEDYKAVINKLDSMDNFSVMIFKEERSMFWQEPKEIPKYIRENYVKIDNVLEYEVFMKKSEDIGNNTYEKDI